MAENNTRTRKDIKEDELLIKKKKDEINHFKLISEQPYSKVSNKMEYREFLRRQQHALYMVGDLNKDLKVMYEMISNTKVKISLDDYLDKKCVKDKPNSKLPKRIRIV
jgi:hypothetical protein